MRNQSRVIGFAIDMASRLMMTRRRNVFGSLKDFIYWVG